MDAMATHVAKAAGVLKAEKGQVTWAIGRP
jgi:hypothetical protein